MELKVRPLNPRETFCCSIRKAKELFRETDIFLNFAWLGREFQAFMEGPTSYYWKHHISGQIIAATHMKAGGKRPILDFLVVKEKIFSPALKTEFEEQYLPKFYDLYCSQRLAIGKNDVFMCVELRDGKLFLHQTKAAW